MLMNADSRKYWLPPDLVLPGDIKDKAFTLPENTSVFFANTKDKLFVGALQKFIPGLVVESTAHLSPESKTTEWEALLENASACVALLTPGTIVDVVLQQQIATAMDLSKEVIVIHDLRQPNEFTDVVQACPTSLREKGVFDHLAVSLYGGDYQHTSMVSKILGAGSCPGT